MMVNLGDGQFVRRNTDELLHTDRILLSLRSAATNDLRLVAIAPSAARKLLVALSDMYNAGMLEDET